MREKSYKQIYISSDLYRSTKKSRLRFKKKKEERLTVCLQKTFPFDMASMVISSSKLKLNSTNSTESLQPPPPSRLRAFKCIYLNATSLENKLDEFKVVIDTYCSQIIAISATWFKSISVMDVNGYNLYRKERNDGHRDGGVCLY